MPRKITTLIIHHSATSRDTTTIQAVDRYHRDKDWGGGARAQKSSLGWYVTYHYFITADGKVTKCAMDDEIRWHAGDENEHSLGICLAGRFDKGFDPLPTKKQVESLTSLLHELTEKHGIQKERIYPHRKFARKTCYGDNLSDTWAEDLLEEDIKKCMNGYQLKGSKEVYIQVGDKYVWVGSWGAFVALGGQVKSIIQLDPSEYVKLPIITKVKLTDNI